MKRYELVIVGGGPAGLAAAAAAASGGVQNILLLERDQYLGGILNQCVHPGFGLQYFREELTGPEYAARFIAELSKYPQIEVSLKSFAVRVTARREITYLKPGCCETVRAKALVMATGCRERTREMIHLPGDRPAGIFSAGLAQKLINSEGLLPGKEAYEKKVGWTKSRFNWNQVCSGGLTVGALAIADEEPQLAAFILNKTATGVQTAMSEFQPDGGTREGPGYWSYAVQFNVMMIAALQSALGTDFGLSRFSGFDQTGRFRIHFVTPLKTVFSFGDGNSTTNANPAMFWLATQFDQPNYAGQDRTLFTSNKPFHLWWFVEEEHSQLCNEPTSAYFQHAGLAFMRSSWDSDAVYVAVKGGSTATGHSHMELGHFQLIADERLWLSDLGGVPYTKDYFHKEKRWTFYRATNLAHNVPVIDGKLQNLNASAPITKFEIINDRTSVEIDLSDAYKGQVESASRCIILEKRIVTIEDIFSGVKGEQFLWQVHAPVRRAVVNETNPRQVDMQHFLKRMRMELLEPQNATFVIEEINIPENQPPVKGITRIAVHLKIDSLPIHIKVRLTPITK
ncbi:MAG: heparinase II/III-family protein [Planctomycetaceae bacterium]|nr:heparinase II/III-family protein [Planctomycetaceae bacterium]